MHLSEFEHMPPQCSIVMKNPQGKAVKEHAIVNGSFVGALAHAAQDDGPHMICLHCEPQGWFHRRKMRWSVTFDVLGEGVFSTSADAISKMAKLHNLKGTQSGIELLFERVGGIGLENDYERNFEAKFEKASTAVNVDVQAFKLLQIVLISGVTAFQIHHLGKFLIKSHLTGCCLPMSRPA